MWAATTALNGLTNHGRKSGDWGVHDIGHNLSYLFDTPHGATLSIAYPAWLRLQKERIPDRIAKLGEHLFDNPSVDGTIERLENFFQLLGSPIKLADIGIGEDKKEMIIEQMVKTEANGMVHKLTDEDRKRMVEYMMG
jgi:alcohol dehydrogenase YqhD (iron-dependent ADH family)